MEAIFLLFFLITGILANRPYPPNSGYPNNDDNRDNFLIEPSQPNCSLQLQPNQGSHQMPNPVLVNSNSNFAFRFFKLASNGGWRANSGKPNLVISPMCISSAFAMLALGARANTLDQILKGLDFKPSEIQERMIHKGFHDLIRKLDSARTGLQVEMGCCLFVEDKLHLQPQFLDGVRNIYGGEIFMENFQNTAEVEQRINSYIERKTHGKISKLVDSIDPITQVLLVSYIYLKAPWKKPFNPKYTELRDFYVDPYSKVKVPMMYQIGMFETARDDARSCTVLKMPYEGHAAAYFILPDEGKLEQVVRSMSSEALESWRKMLSRSSVSIFLPKCMASGELHLKDIMYTLGIVDVFTDRADLSGITGQPQHRLSGAVHKAVMMIDERGTEASAASSMDMVPMSVPLTITFNRPFSMIIDDEDSILFMAKITNPAEN
ncbi:hypothetical protein lerEdw1_013015 [Lerista edwardsae]|nr:hypothetical protein lerEdw1_013015 [Lerista edwardsae]